MNETDLHDKYEASVTLTINVEGLRSAGEAEAMVERILEAANREAGRLNQERATPHVTVMAAGQMDTRVEPKPPVARRTITVEDL